MSVLLDIATVEFATCVRAPLSSRVWRSKVRASPRFEGVVEDLDRGSVKSLLACETDGSWPSVAGIGNATQNNQDCQS